MPFHKFLIARKGCLSLSPTARYLYAEKKGMPIEPSVDQWDPVLHEVWEELGTEKFCSRLFPCELEYLHIPTRYNLDTLDVMYDPTENFEFVEQKHGIWIPEHEDGSAIAEAALPSQAKKGRAIKEPALAVQRIVVNRAKGISFKLSDKAVALYSKVAKTDLKTARERVNQTLPRNDPLLVAVVEKLGAEAGFRGTKIIIMNIPQLVKGWIIEDCDGREWVSEPYRKWLPSGHGPPDLSS